MMLSQQKISRKFLYLFIPTIIIIFLLTVSIITVKEYRGLQEALEKKGNDLAVLYTIALETPLWNIDEEQINQLLNASLKDKEIVAVIVNDETSGAHKKYSRNENLISDHLLVFHRDILHRGRIKIGSVTFYLTRDVTLQIIKNSAVSFAITLIILLTTAIIISIAILRKLIYRPIINLLDGINLNVAQKTCHPVTVSSRDEIGILTESFNNMMKRLKEDAGNLEQMVAEREILLKELGDNNLALQEEISKRKIAGEELKKAEIKYRSIFDNAAYGIYQTTLDGKLLTANSALARILGYDSPEDIINNISHIVTNLFVDSTQKTEFLKLMKKRDLVKNFEFKAFRKDGSEIFASMNSRAVRDENNHVLFFEGILEDVTEKKQLEYLKIAKEAAEASTRSKSEFLAHMSHEIRTPMNAIIGFANLALMTELSAKQMDYISKIEAAANSLLEVINDILDFSKIEAGKLEMSSVNFHLHDVIRNMADIVSVRSAEKGIELIISIDDNVPYALIGDPLRLRQILINLTNNAVKFTESGYVLVEVTAADVSDSRCRLRFTIQDTGIGIPEEQLAKLFAAFSQGDASLTRKFGGTGLGLVISRQLVNMMGGDISVVSTPGKGSTFSFTALFQLQVGEKQTHMVVPEDLRGLHVLVVDDNAIVRSILQHQLQSFQLNVETADSGEEAMEVLARAAESKPYDLILMDWYMPGMDGIETTRKIKKDLRLNHVPLIIMLTAFGREEVKKEAEDAEINGFLLKPANPSMLFDTIMNVLGKPSNAATRPLPSYGNSALDMQKIAGAKVLLVEDNIINQQVAREVLESAGLIVEIANNGRDAVNAARMNEYDLVMMDIQMPIMGGYEATQLIRMDKTNACLPIIAMTAHAMQGIKDECLAAGMNDYVSKPIDIQELFGVLGKWIKRRSETPGECLPQTTDITITESEQVQLPVFLPGIDLDSGLQRLCGNKSLYKKLLLDFMHNYRQIIPEIQSALKRDEDVAHRLTHTIKGIAGNLSAGDVQRTAHELDIAIIGRKKNDYDTLLADLDRSLQILLHSISTLQEEENHQQPVEDHETPVDYEKITPILQEMAQLLKKDNLTAVKYVEIIKESFGPSLFRDEINQMEKYIRNIEFAEALKLLEKIIDEIAQTLKEKC